MENNNLIPFEGKIRKAWHDKQWYFVLIDVILILTDSKDPKQYLEKMRKRDTELDSYLRTNCTYVDVKGETGKTRKYLCANIESIFRTIMSISSPKVEPLKIWLAEQGKRAIDETENPELITQRQIDIYKAKGYPEEWIVRRVQTIETRKQLTDEWKNRGVIENTDFSILTATIAKGTFGLNPNEHSKLKGLDKQNLRDHMTPMELILTAFSEEATRQIAERDKAQGFNENHDAAQLGGKIGGDARKNFESNTGLKVVSEENFLHLKDLKEGETDALPDGKK